MELTCYNVDNQEVTHLTQWDLNQTIIIKSLSTSDTVEVHATNLCKNIAYICESTYDGSILTFEVPNILLQEDSSLKIYIYLIEASSSAKTVYTIRIPVIPRPKPIEYEFIKNALDISYEEFVEAYENVIKATEDTITATKDAYDTIQYANVSIEKFSSYIASANLCDDEWEIGGFSNGDENDLITNYFRSKNYLPVIGGKTIYQYNSKKIGFTVYQYDENKNFIGTGGLTLAGMTKEGKFYNNFCTLNSNTKYIRLLSSGTDFSGLKTNIFYEEDAKEIFKYNINNTDGTDTIVFEYIEPYIYSKGILDEVKANKVTVENTYNSASENPQSGKAVADAITDLSSEVSNAIKGIVKDKTIQINDVSPLEHDVVVKAECKNLVKSYTNGTTSAQYNSCLYVKADLKPSTTYTISFVGESGHKVYFNEKLFTDNPEAVLTNNRQTFTVTTKDTISTSDSYIYSNTSGWIILKNNGGNTVTPAFSDVQIELGDTATEYTPYIDLTALTVTEEVTSTTYSFDTNGICSIPSISPTMKLSTNNTNVTIECEYSRDVNEVLKEYQINVENTYNSASENAISGKGVADALSQIEAENTVKEGSTKPVSGGAVYTALQNVEIDVDIYMSDTSENPVQNKTLKLYIDSEISDAVTSGAISQSGDIRLKPNFANDTDECIDTSKVYVLPNGFIYAYMKSTVYPEITTKENSVGYYYDNKGVVTWYADNPNSCSKETNLIPVNEGDIFNVTLRGTNGHAVNGAWYDADKNLISVIKLADTNNNAVTTELTAPAGAKYAWFISYNFNTNISSVPWSIEWVYCSTATSEGWTNTGHAFVPADYESEILDHEKRLEQLESQKVESILKGKKIVYDGDSLCAPGGNLNGGAYPKLIADLVGGTYDNQAVGGARIVTAKGATNKDGVSVTLSHSVVDNLVNLPTNADLYCFECCVNDQFNMVTLGDFNPTEYSEDKLSLNTKEYCGALETIIRYALTNFNGAPVCFIIPHKCYAQGDYGNGFTFADFREKIIGLFEKYAIPYYDAWAESGLNYWNKPHLDYYFLNFDTNTEIGDGDACHPNTDGYKKYYVPQLINLFEKIMPRD